MGEWGVYISCLHNMYVCMCAHVSTRRDLNKRWGAVTQISEGLLYPEGHLTSLLDLSSSHPHTTVAGGAAAPTDLPSCVYFQF